MATPTKSQHLEPARSILLKLGRSRHAGIGAARNDLSRGIQVACDITGRTSTSVYRWLYHRERGGTGGQVPKSDTIMILAWAENNHRHTTLRPADFYPKSTANSDCQLTG
jgi:hypothetical protein